MFREFIKFLKACLSYRTLNYFESFGQFKTVIKNRDLTSKFLINSRYFFVRRSQNFVGNK